MINKVSTCNYGCRLGLFMSNIIAYADDLVVMAPSVTALQNILNICFREATNLSLTFNPNKSFCIKFFKGRKYEKINARVSLGNVLIDFIEKTNYLGFDLNFNLCNANDINRERSKFYKSFNSIFRRFYSVNIEILLFLFKSHCSQFYGSGLWTNYKGSSNVFRQFSVAYHNALKKS